METETSASGSGSVSAFVFVFASDAAAIVAGVEMTNNEDAGAAATSKDFAKVQTTARDYMSGCLNDEQKTRRE